jgi:hypothetical protein
VLMLEEVGRFLAGQTVGMLGGHGFIFWSAGYGSSF